MEVRTKSMIAARGVLPEKLGGGVRPASQNPYPSYDQNLRYSLPYLWPDHKFQTFGIKIPFQTWVYDWIPSSDQY